MPKYRLLLLFISGLHFYYIFAKPTILVITDSLLITISATQALLSRLNIKLFAESMTLQWR
jgi:hypothetical protein